MFTAPEGTYPNGIRDVFRHTLKHEGVPALFKGVVPIMLRAFPANAVSILKCTMMKKIDIEGDIHPLYT